MQLTPFEANKLIFIDTEFSDLDPYTGELLSVGIVKLNGEELYLELEHGGEVSPWVAEHVVPLLGGAKVSRKEAVRQIRQFIGRAKPYAVAFVDNYDALYSVKLFGSNEALPFQWMTIDFASILFGAGINPKRLLAEDSEAHQFYASLGLDLKAFRPHHALDDACLLREVWLRVVNNS